MMYTVHEAQRRMMATAGAVAGWSAGLIANPANPWSRNPAGRGMQGMLEMAAHAAASWPKPEFGLKSTIINGETVAIREEVVLSRAFGDLLHFAREGVEGGEKLLIVAPMSGHYATLLRGTVERMLPKHDVYITDWADARDVPLSEGKFGLDDYMDYVMGFLRHLGPGAHLLAVCQPSVPCYAATCIMAADEDPCRPKTLTMMGGPIDTRNGPTEVNWMASKRPHAWFKEMVIAKVPTGFVGAGRRVYPGFLQLSSFMSMNLANHINSHWRMARNIADGDSAGAETIKDFYAEYRAVCDMTAEFYLETVDKVFQRHLLPKGELTYRDRKVDPAAIRDVAILAVEGERDDISGLGQTRSALDIATSLPDSFKKYHMAPGAGHYGIFNGSKWRNEVAPVVEDWIVSHAR
jgi:poly(3-hydroxybutyrate) depolymerase